MITILLFIAIIFIIMGLFSSNTVAIPMTKRNFYTEADTNGIKRQYANIKAKYGTYIAQAANNSNIPEWLIYAFIIIESGGDANAISGGTYGLGQLLPIGIQDIIWLENKDKKIIATERKAIEKQLGVRAKNVLTVKLKTGATSQITKADLQNAEFNIQCMAIYLSRLIDECTINGIVRYDQIVVGYNIGYYSQVRKTIKAKDIEQIIDTLNHTTRDYVLKLAGRNGTIETILKT
jgi:hypothetical protein